MEEINYALVEEKRPPAYTAMKYWGKKPHNIWRKYIVNYTPENGIFLDPFAGSAMSAFEAVKVGRKAIAFDLNPLTTFFIECFANPFNKDLFKIEANRIYNKILESDIYKKYYSTKCRVCGKTNATAQNFKWDDGKLYEIGVYCENCNGIKLRKSLEIPTVEDVAKSKEADKIEIETWFPSEKFHNSPSFGMSFLKNIGGNSYSNLWTNRNLAILSMIFDEISQIDDKNLQRQLLFGFIKSCHLSSKMCIPRRKGANRGFSTSWGRSAYISSKRQMEMNPLLLFIGSCFGKQSVSSAILSMQEYIGKMPKLLYVDQSNRSNKTQSFDIKYGIVDINTIQDYIEPSSVDFILTDPPYGGLVQYLDLSQIWLVWLSRIDSRLKSNFDSEITVKPGIQTVEVYQARFTKAITNLNSILKPEGKLVLTFHNKELSVWNAFLKSITISGFHIEKVIHQQNRRTGESNVSNPYGTSASDFYIRCIKNTNSEVKSKDAVFENFVINKAIFLIAERNEATPFDILFNGLLASISSSGYSIEDFDQSVEGILSKQIGKIFTLQSNDDSKAGNYWWFVDPNRYIKYPDKKLSERVEDTIVSFLRQNIAVTFDEVLGRVFVKYPNGLTPDIKSIPKILAKYANKSSGKWVYKGGEIEKNFTNHSENLYYLTKIGHVLGYKVYIGKREQPEYYKGKKLCEYADYLNLQHLGLVNEIRARVEMVDMLWISKDGRLQYAIEVENSTNFTSGIQRASNLGIDLPKIMVLPNYRESEFKSIIDPLFVSSFTENNWSYLYYSDVLRLQTSRNLSINDLNTFLMKL